MIRPRKHFGCRVRAPSHRPGFGVRRLEGVYALCRGFAITTFIFTLVLTFVASDTRFLAETGTSWIVPGGVRHTFRVESETARLVAVYAPAGVDHCFRNAGLPAAAPTLPPPDAPARPLEEIEEVMRNHGHHNFGPPMGPDD